MTNVIGLLAAFFCIIIGGQSNQSHLSWINYWLKALHIQDTYTMLSLHEYLCCVFLYAEVKEMTKLCSVTT